MLRPVHLVADLRNLPDLALWSYSIWVPFLIALVVFVLFEVSGGNLSNQSLQALAFNLLIFPPPIAIAILAGLLTQRSSYLAGGIVGLLAAIFFALYVMTATFAPSSSGVAVTNDIRVQNAVYALVVSPLFGLAFGGFGGFVQRLVRAIVGSSTG